MTTAHLARRASKRRRSGGARYGLAAAIALTIALGAGFIAASGGAVPKVSNAVVVDGEGPPVFDRVAIARPEPQVAAADSGLPNGASSLNETYKDWHVACVLQANAKRCVVSQMVVQQNGQRVLAIELNAPRDKAVSGTLILPFGLSLDAGVIFQVDDKPATAPLRFRTCLPGGCLVNVAFDASALDTLRAGTALKIQTVADGGTPTPFTVSLLGFGTALDRIEALSR